MAMSSRSVFSGAVFLVVWLTAACGSVDRRRRMPTPGNDPAVSATASTSAPAPIQPLAFTADASPSLDAPLSLRPLAGAALHAARDRGAILIAADRYRALPTFDLPQLERSVSTLAQTLDDACSIPTAALVQKNGPAAIPQEIEGAIADFGESVTGSKPLLLVFYTGHGVVDGDGQLQLFTHYTDRTGSAYTNTLARRDLLRWLGAARARAKARGVDLATVLIVDACRTPTLSGGAPRAKLVRDETWEIYSTSEGELADAPRDEATPFASALCASLAALGTRGEADLDATFAEVKRRLVAGNAAQTPQLVGPSDTPSPVVVQPGRVRMGLRVVDSMNDTLVAVGERGVLVDGKPLARADDFFVLETVAGRNVQVRTEAAGYGPFTSSINVRRDDNGKVFAVPLRPAFVRVRGRVTPVVAVAITAECDDERAVPRPGFHKLRADTAMNNPEFELVLPPAAPDARTRIVCKQFNRELAAKVVDFSTAQADPRIEGARTVDLGIIELVGADTGGLPSVANEEAVRAQAAAAFAQDDTGGIKPPPQFAAPDLAAPELSDSFQRITWDEALKAYQAGKLELARAHLTSLEKSLRGGGNDSVSNFLGHVELRMAVLAGNDQEVEKMVAQAQPTDGALAMALRAVLAARKLRRAAELAEKGDQQTVALLREASMCEPDGDSPYAVEARGRIRELRWTVAARLYDTLPEDQRRAVAEQLRADNPEAWNDPSWSQLEQPRLQDPIATRLREGLELGMGKGDWSVADSAIDQRRHVFPDQVPQTLLDLEVRIARERVPLSVRESFAAAADAESGGRLDQALDLFTKALEGANAHWRGMIEERQRSLREQVFRREIGRANTVTDPATKLDALLRAAQAMGRPAPGLQEHLAAHQDLAAKPEVRSMLAAIDQSQLAAARASRSQTLWQEYLADHPLGAGAVEARAMLARMANPWQQVRAAELPRYGHALAFDEARGVSVMFGGLAAERTVRDDTWTWDGQAWTQVTPPSQPPARVHHAMAYDAARRSVVLFGGSRDGDDKAVLNDTWLWDGSTWRAVESTPRPPARSKHALAYDSERGRVVLYGGDGHKDTWEWDGERWANVSPRKGNPGERIGAGMAFSRPERRVVLFGGDGRAGDAWFWNGSGWLSSKTTGVEGSDGATLVTAGDRVLCFGGTGRQLRDDLLSYAGSWGNTRLGTPPSARQFHAACFDTRRNMLIVHGGFAPGARRRDPGQVFGDTWELVVEP
jgi:hypothetical protein